MQQDHEDRTTELASAHVDPRVYTMVAQVAADLAAVKGALTAHDLSATSAIHGVGNRVMDTQAKQIEVGLALDNMCNVLNSVLHELGSHRDAINDQTRIIRDDRGSSCAWREYVEENPEVDVFASISRIAGMEPLLAAVVEDALAASGRDPKTGNRREWLNVQVDRIRTSIGTVIVSALAALILGGMVWVWFAGQRVLQQQTTNQSLQELQNKLNAAEAENQRLRAR